MNVEWNIIFNLILFSIINSLIIYLIHFASTYLELINFLAFLFIIPRS